MKLWITRDRRGNVLLHSVEPHLVHDIMSSHWFGDYDSMELDEEDFPEVTFENSPMEVELKLINNDTKD